MNHRGIDAERLASLIDGKLPDGERAELLANLAASPEELEVFANAIAASQEAAATGSQEPREPILRIQATGQPTRRWLAVAAALVGLALGSVLYRHFPRGPDDPARFVALLSTRELPGGWDGHPWSTLRGGEGAGTAEPLAPRARAGRLGARLIDLELAVARRDTAAAPIADEIATLLEGVPAGGPAAALYRDVSRRAGSPPEELKPELTRARRAAARLAGPELVELGAWAEAARLASARQDVHYFGDRESRRVLERAAHRADLPAPALEVIHRLRFPPPPGVPVNWPSRERELTDLLRTLGSP